MFKLFIHQTITSTECDDVKINRADKVGFVDSKRKRLLFEVGGREKGFFLRYFYHR